ncbi:MAG: SH3 domain-containing protein [Bacteroidota bacterium]
MKKLLIMLGCIVGSHFCHAQTEIYAQGCFSFEKGSSSYTFNDSMNVRTAPHLKATIADTLTIGTEIFIDERLDSILVAGGKAAPWYFVHYTKNNTSHKGYIWGGNLCLTPMRRAETKFLFGLKGLVKRKAKDSNEIFDVMVAEMKALRNDSIIAKVSWDVGSTESLASNTAKVLPGGGLKNVKYLLLTSLSGEACGVAAITQYIAWTGEKLLLLPQLMSVGDAGVYFHDEVFVFPADKNGKPGKIYKKTEEEETDEKEKTTSKKYTVTFLWDGEKAIKQ